MDKNNFVSNNVSELLNDQVFIKFLISQVKGVFENNYECKHLQSNILTFSGCYECTREFIQNSTLKNYFVSLYQWFHQNHNYSKTINQISGNQNINNKYEIFFFPVDMIKCFKSIWEYLTPEQGSYFCSPWLDGIFSIINLNNIRITKLIVIFKTLCAQGHLETLQWLYKCEEQNLLIDIHEAQQQIFQRVYKQYPNILSWLVSSNLLNQLRYDVIKTAFKEVCGLGNLKVVKLLLELNGNQRIDESVTNGYSFTYACENGQLEVIKFLLNLEDDRKVKDSKIIKNALLESCEKGYLEIIKFLLALDGEQRINLNDIKQYIFSIVCEKGHLEVIKFLLELKGDRYIIVNTNKEHAFKMACSLGHIEVVKLLLELKENQRITKDTIDNIFEEVCVDGNVEMVRLLLSLKDDRLINVNNNCGFIRACQSCQPEVVRLLLKLEGDRRISSTDITDMIDDLSYDIIHSTPPLYYKDQEKILKMLNLYRDINFHLTDGSS